MHDACVTAAVARRLERHKAPGTASAIAAFRRSAPPAAAQTIGLAPVVRMVELTKSLGSYFPTFNGLPAIEIERRSA